MTKYIKIVIAIFVLYGCNNENNQLKEVKYYPDSKVIKSEKFFDSFEDKKLGNYIMFEYDSLGVKKCVCRCKNNILDGRGYMFYTNGNIKRIVNYRNGVANGIRKKFTEKGHMTIEILSINGRDILWKNFIEYTVPKSYGYKIFPVRNDTAFEYEGRIIYDTNMNIIDSVTFYYDVYKVNDPSFEDVKLKVKLLGTAYNKYKTNINLMLGELNIENFSRYILLDTIGIIKSDKNELEFSCGQFKYTDDLITGLLQLELYSLDGKEKIRDKYFTFYYDLNSD